MSEQSQTTEYQFLKTEAAKSRGEVAWYMLPISLATRPGKFMRSFGIHANILFVLLAAWIIGASGMINTVVNRVRLAPQTLPIPIDSWTTVWAVVLGLGILRGVLFGYGLGGLWTWLKLRICGIKSNEWKRSTRLYCFSVSFEQTASLLVLLYFTLKYDTLRDFIAQPVGLVNLAVGLIMLSSPIIAFVSVLACYKLRIVWATILFLLIPMLWRLVFLGVLGWSLITSSGSVLLPDTQHPVAASNEVFSFDHPKDWTIRDPAPLDEHTVAQIEVESNTDTASVLIRVLPIDGIDPNDHDLRLINTMGYTVTDELIRPDAQLGVLRCYSVEFKLTNDAKQYKMLHLVAALDSQHGVLIRMLTTPRYWDASIRAAMQIIDSLAIKNLNPEPPQIESPIPNSKDWFNVQSPANWTLGGETHAQFEAIEFQAFGDTSIRFTIYDRTNGGGDSNDPAKELETLLSHGMHKDRMISYTPMSSWYGLSGHGAQGTIWMPLTGPHDFRAIFVPLEDGRTLGIKEYRSKSSADLAEPGFTLIESTFKLLIDPAEVDP
jgi:hypothetical protein